MTLLLLLNGSPQPKHRVIVGAVTMSVTPSAIMDFTRHAGMVGAVTVTVTPSSSMDFTRHAAIAGSVATTLTPTAALDFTRHAAIAGSVTVALVPAGVMHYRAAPHIIGSVTVGVTPSAAMHATIAPVTPSSVGGWARPRPRTIAHRSLVAAARILPRIRAALAFHAHPETAAISGAIALSTRVAGVMVFAPNARAGDPIVLPVNRSAHPVTRRAGVIPAHVTPRATNHDVQRTVAPAASDAPIIPSPALPPVDNGEPVARARRYAVHGSLRVTFVSRPGLLWAEHAPLDAPSSAGDWTLEDDERDIEDILFLLVAK